MNTQKTLNRSLKFIAKVILGFIVGISFGFGVGKFIKTDNRLTSSIEKAIQQNCDCELVEKNISTVGFQFAKEETKCNNEFLKVAVDKYEVINLFELSSNPEGHLELVKIKNGTIL